MAVAIADGIGLTGAALCRDCLWTGPENLRRCPRCNSPRVVRHPELTTLTVAHVDCDAFFASVEKRDRPELADQPVIVGGGRRGVVSTACYIARTYGVRSAMPMFKALQACPHAIVVRPDLAKYKQASEHIFGKLAALTPLLQRLSIDEAWLDLSGAERLNRAPAAVALARVQREIERESGLTVSVGLAPNKFLAKIASDLDKPRGFSIVGAGDAKVFLEPRPAAILPGVGPAFARSLERLGLRTVGDLARADPKDLVRRFGVNGLRLSELAQGRDMRPVDPDESRKGVSAETTFDEDLARLADLEDRLWPCCEKVAAKVRREGVAGGVVTLKLKTADFRLITRRRTLPSPTQTAKALFAVSRELLRAEAKGGVSYRLIGAGLSDLVAASDAPSDLFGEGETRARQAENAIDRLRGKFGASVVVSGRALNKD